MNKLPFTLEEVKERLSRVQKLSADSAIHSATYDEAKELIRIDLGYTIETGSELKFKSPISCSRATGLVIYYPDASDIVNFAEFAFADANGNNVGAVDHLFAEAAIVKVILDLNSNKAFVQNADTNAYIENNFNKIHELVGNTPVSEQISVLIDNLDNLVYVSEENQESAVVPLNADTLQGKAASAFAPAGYGLGTVQPIEWSNIDNITANGWYSAVTNGEIVTGLSAYMAWIRVDALDTNYACQTLYATGNTGILKRYKQGGTWSEWEWENPPMAMGVEYRTTERHNGLPVFVKLVNYGYITAGESVIPHGIAGIDDVVSLDVINRTYGVFSNSKDVSSSADRTNIVVNSAWAMGGFIYVIKYTKL